MAFEKVSKALIKVFGSRDERLVKACSAVAREAGAFEEQVKQLDDTYSVKPTPAAGDQRDDAFAGE